jgi:hypothetical protein
MATHDDDLIQRELDDELIAELRRVAAEADPVPADVLLAAQAAIGTRDLDGELAELVGDTVAELDGYDGDALPGQLFEAVRAGADGFPASRLLSFAGGGVQVDLEVSRVGDHFELIGQLTGAAPDSCLLEGPHGRTRRLDLDGLGRFVVNSADAGPVRLCCRSTTGTRVRTSWVTI